MSQSDRVIYPLDGSIGSRPALRSSTERQFRRNPAARRPSRSRNIAVGRRIRRSAIIEKALSQPKRRSDGKLEKTVAASPHARITEVKITAGPTSAPEVFLRLGGKADGLLWAGWFDQQGCAPNRSAAKTISESAKYLDRSWSPPCAIRSNIVRLAANTSADEA
jgi:hypothetical protein